jgi:hypothetical protein
MQVACPCAPQLGVCARLWCLAVSGLFTASDVDTRVEATCQPTNMQAGRTDSQAHYQHASTNMQAVAEGERGASRTVEELERWNEGAEAQWELGRRYLHGCGVPMDAVKAVGWLQKAADQKHVDAQYELGLCYLHGVEKRPKPRR